MKPWKRIEPTEVSKVGFRVITSKIFEYADGTTGRYDVNGTDGFAGVATIALTADKKVVIVRQFRAGPERIMDELPGGFVEIGEESQLEAAAKRELEEETAYVPGRMKYLGKLSYDAHSNGWRHYFLAYDCKNTAQPRMLDESEQHEVLEIHEITINELFDNARQGSMTDPGAVLLAYEELTTLNREK
jgi:ADP-ribose pyrophosphatase